MHLTFGFWQSDDIPMVRMITEQLSIEAGFTYDIELVGEPRNCSAAFLAKTNGSCSESFGAMFFDVLDHYDATGPWWVVTPIRQRGHDFTPPFVDTALALFTTASPEMHTINWLSFAAPFTGEAWLLVLLVCIFTALCMFFYEEGIQPGESLLQMEKDIASKVEQTLEGLIAGMSVSDANSAAGKVTTFSFMFVILVVISAYTANTAAFLTVAAA
jgi:hypothetical protein